MKNFYLVAIFIAFFTSFSVLQSQNLDWTTPAATGTGNETIALLGGSVLLNNAEVTQVGALLGVFYLNNSGDYTCGGYIALDQNYIDGNNIAIAAWGEDAGEDNGFDPGETMNFFLNLNGVDYPANSISFAQGDDQFLANDMTVILEINFSEQQIELDPCSCIDGSGIVATPFSNFCVLTGDYCTDPAADNYCNVEGFSVLGANENCVYGAVEGCTCPTADNYDSSANSDDGSCYITNGCSNPLADNYSLQGCTDVEILNEYCELPGCTCPEALNYDATATVNDGSCAAIVSICTDPTATNFNEGCENTNIFGAEENCEYGEIQCELEDIVWDYTITDANMTIQVYQAAILLNGEEPPCGSLLGGFYTNDAGELQCAGYKTWCDDFSAGQLAIPLFASETGLDNGFEQGEEITWLLFVGNQTFSASNISMTNGGGFTDTFLSLIHI